MSELKDSGNRREFDSGAVRDIAEGKGRLDLVPLRVIARLMDNAIIGHIGAYMESGNTNEIDMAIKEFIYDGLLLPFDDNEKIMAAEMLDLGKHFEKGCLKYGDRNWEAGITAKG